MSFLDRFKLQPRYKSVDPDLRVAGVQELSDSTEDTAVLAALAREDTDVRVRRAAAASAGVVWLRHNVARTELMGANRAEAASMPGFHARLVDELEESGALDRDVDLLPTP